MRAMQFGRERVLVIGGTLFIGKILVQQLLQDGAEVTLLSRGRRANPFAGRVRSLIADRQNPDSFLDAVDGQEFDVVYDQLCFSAEDAETACTAFSGRVRKYIMTSSQAVYGGKPGCHIEEVFDPLHFAPQAATAAAMGGVYTGSSLPVGVTYAEGKRQAEAGVARGMKSLFSLVRFPMVLGNFDPTGRLPAEVKRGLSGSEVPIHPENGKLSVIEVSEAARFLSWLRRSNLQGPVNAAAPEGLDAQMFFAQLGEIAGRKITLKPSHAVDSKLSYADTFLQDCGKAERAGFTFTRIAQWLPEILRSEVEAMNARAQL